MLRKTGIIAFTLLIFAAWQGIAYCQDTGNPLLHESTLPYEAPPFDKIEPSDFMPAFKAGMRRQLKAVKRIAANDAKPTFENTILALEKSGQLLTRVQNVFGILTSADTNPKLQKIRQKVAPKLAAHYDAIYLNDKLFERVEAVYKKRKSLDLAPESMRLVEYYYDQFVRAGANLSEEAQEKLKEINKKIASLTTTFNNKLLGATKTGALVVDDKSLLKGLSKSQLKMAKQNAEDRGLEGKWVLELENTTRQSLLRDLDKRKVRKKLFFHSWNRAAKSDTNDTRGVVEKLAEARAERAKILGYPNHAAWKLQNQMAGNPETVMNFLTQLVEPAKAEAREEAEALQELIYSRGKDFELKPWDWYYFAEILRKKKFDINTDSVRQYFKLNNVLKKGVFYAANQLYGITFEERHDIPTWNEEVRVFTVYDKDGSKLGLFYADYFSRDGKSGGAWMSNLVTQSYMLNQKPVIYNVMNIPEPPEGEPALLSFEQVMTMFHEFGHALHGFLAEQKYPSLSGTKVARDFVEFPSQFFEHFALNDEVFNNYAIHYKTGEPMPQAMVEKIKKSRQFNNGYGVTELLEAALLDMQWYTIPASKDIKSVEKFGKQALIDVGIYIPVVPPRYRSSYFAHIFGSGYSAGYYAYIWTHMLSANAFDWFQEHGGMTLENGQRFREMILSQGNTEDLAKIFKEFVGHEPKVEPLLEEMGLE